MKRNLLAFAALLLVIPSIASTCFNDGTLCLQFVSPKPESIYHRPETRIVIRHGEVLDISALQLNPGLLSVAGSISGNHVCTYWLASDQKTLQIVPQTPFEYGETVSVEISGLRIVSGNVLLPEFGYSFSTMNAPPATLSAEVAHNDELEAESGDRDFPSVTTLTLNNPAPGNIFMGITGLQKFISILDNEGNDPPLWFQETNGDGNDFKIQESGYLTYFARTPQFWYVMNDEIEIVDTLHMLNGYLCDDHECLYLADGHYFLQCYDHQTMDLSGEVPGGNVAADVIGYIWQEIDANEDLLMEWRSWDYLDMFESYHVSWTSDQLDLWHGNSIERDADMNILVSLRNTDEILKINGATGEIIWRFGGGLYNQFDLLGGDGFTYQHDARVLPNGHITVYNNGNYNSPQVSSCQEYALNEITMTATKVWEYLHPDGLFAPSMGGCRRLSNGNTFINWGNVLNDSWGARVSEVRPNGFVDLEYAFPSGQNAYRSYKSEWFFSETVVGCTDPNAVNFNPDAPILNDMYCEYDVDEDGFSAEDGDCDDNNGGVFPGAEEIPNDGIDQDCVDGDLVLTDADDDGYYAQIDDCDDNDNSIYPDAPEIANDDIDQDCDGDDLVLKDLDGDDDGFDYLLDCDDDNDQVYPGAVEIPYDGIDQDCADGDLTDVDGDGISGPDDDCDDNNESVFPGANEIPYDGIDQDCADGDLTDVDGDGVAGPDNDCDDNNNSIYPGAIEIPYDGIDQDCTDGDLTDVDGDGVSGPDDDCNDEDESIYPGADEIANDGIDQDCVGGDLIISVEESLENLIQISPQPAGAHLAIRSPIEISFDVVDATGRLVYHAQQVYMTVIDCTTWNGGIYLLHITDGSHRTAVMKVVVE